MYIVLSNKICNQYNVKALFYIENNISKAYIILCVCTRWHIFISVYIGANIAFYQALVFVRCYMFIQNLFEITLKIIPGFRWGNWFLKLVKNSSLKKIVKRRNLDFFFKLFIVLELFVRLNQWHLVQYPKYFTHLTNILQFKIAALCNISIEYPMNN